MCLAVPGRILRMFDADDTLMSDVDFGGVVTVSYTHLTLPTICSV